MIEIIPMLEIVLRAEAFANTSLVALSLGLCVV
jgi:hypothetical protein